MRNRLTKELAICGFNAVKALADTHPDRINRLFLREEHLPHFTRACKLLAAEKRPYKLCDDEELERLCKSPRHQGVVAMMVEPEVPPMDRETLNAWVEGGDRILILDSVGNDNNLGAIVRSAAFFGFKHLVLSSEDKEARLTTSAYRVAEGGMEHVDFHSVSNMGGFLADARRELVVIGADHRSRNRLSELSSLIDSQKTGQFGVASTRWGLGAHLAVAIVLGNEERGLSEASLKACSVLVRIPGTGLVESLNVAQAATLFMHELYD